jgi:hypothetical protein
MVWKVDRHRGQHGASRRDQVQMVSMMHCRQKRSWRHGSSWKSAARSRHTTHMPSSSSAASDRRRVEMDRSKECSESRPRWEMLRVGLSLRVAMGLCAKLAESGSTGAPQWAF